LCGQSGLAGFDQRAQYRQVPKIDRETAVQRLCSNPLSWRGFEQ
jgi:hypothetical protein